MCSGTTVDVTFPDGSVGTVSYLCTSVPPSNSSSATLPTIWFLSDQAHGVVDFLGLQTVLATVHGRNSCSYDLPNFGWSSRMPASVPTAFDPLDLLLETIGRASEPRVLAAWGAGGDNALPNAVAHPDVVKALVLMDVSPDGIEWFDMQRAMNWTDAQMLRFRQVDLQNRITLTNLILTIGVPW
jgi:pimeloyl-ACP methyl ester carboxylesterase